MYMQTCKLSIKCVAWLKKEIFGNWGKKNETFRYIIMYCIYAIPKVWHQKETKEN